MFSHERFAFVVGLRSTKLEEAVVTRRFCLGTSATTRIGTTNSRQVSELIGEGRRGIAGQRSREMTDGFKPWGLRGFCLGSVGSYGSFAAGGDGGVGDQRAVIYRISVPMLRKPRAEARLD